MLTTMITWVGICTIMAELDAKVFAVGKWLDIFTCLKIFLLAQTLVMHLTDHHSTGTVAEQNMILEKSPTNIVIL